MSETPAITPQDVTAGSAYVGRREVRRQILEVETLRRFASVVGADLDVERQIPPLGHWAYFLEAAPADGLGPDGHPLRGGRSLLPPINLPRRMFAAGALHFGRPLVLGREAQLTLTVAEVKHRAGKTGDLVFVEVDRSLTQEGAECVSERQTLVYRAAGERVPATQTVDLPARADEQAWTPSSMDLFRFSAVTFNSHRIHYDLPYAQEEEGYPGLVVHGPFTAAKLCALAASCNDKPMRCFAFRATAPIFLGQTVRLRPGPEAGQVEAVRGDGVAAMSAEAQFGEFAGA